MIPAVILAAGFSSRMGRDKALLQMPGGDSFATRLSRTFLQAGCDQVVVVVGRAFADRAADDFARAQLQVRLTINPDPSRGQLSSLHVALDTILPGTPRGVLMCPVNQPLVAEQTVRLVMASWETSRAAIVRPAHGGRHGHPVLFDARVLAELRAADVAAGARVVVRAHAHEAEDVETDDPGAYEDVDTPEDYRRVFGVDVSAAGTAAS